MTATKTLQQLGLTAADGHNPDISGIGVDCREVKRGYLFAALPGVKVHGGEFIQYALRMGACAILTDAVGVKIAADELAASDAVLITTDDPRGALAFSAALWFGAQPLVMTAVTGTNGKTSVSTFVRQIWNLLDLEAVNLGTTGVEGSMHLPLAHSTPEPITLHRTLATLSREGISHAAMEASSHGLDQRRLDGVNLAAAGFTNFTQDHLDYHGTFEAYFDAKMGLFTRVLQDDGVAVVNLDDAKGAEVAMIAQSHGHELIGVGKDPEADLCLLGQRFDGTGQDLLFKWHDRPFQARLKLIGAFQAENVLLAAGLVIAAGEDPARVFDTLGDLETVRGRMQLVATRTNGASIFVDYAHTPDAVETTLKAMRPHVMGRLVALIGAGGDRDTSKRPLMGQAAAKNADLVFVTDDNPRSEDPAMIREAVMGGASDAIEVADRAEAILRAVDALGPGDALLIAGKGHETGQVVGETVFPFDDCEQASVAVSALDGGLA